MRRLELPPTLRTLNSDEAPKNSTFYDGMTKALNANIVEGYTLRYNTNHEPPFKFYAEINIDNSRFWSLFKTLMLHLPDEVSLIFNDADSDIVFYGKYRDKFEVLNGISSYSIELTQDCFLEFGVIHQTDSFLEEVFVDCTKYIKYWGMDETWFRATMHDFQIFETPELNFMDEFPKVRESLSLHHKSAVKTEDILEQWQILFT